MYERNYVFNALWQRDELFKLEFTLHIGHSFIFILMIFTEHKIDCFTLKTGGVCHLCVAKTFYHSRV